MTVSEQTAECSGKADKGKSPQLWIMKRLEMDELWQTPPPQTPICQYMCAPVPSVHAFLNMWSCFWDVVSIHVFASLENDVNKKINLNTAGAVSGFSPRKHPTLE